METRRENGVSLWTGRIRLPPLQACLGMVTEGDGRANRSQRTPASVAERIGITKARAESPTITNRPQKANSGLEPRKVS